MSCGRRPCCTTFLNVREIDATRTRWNLFSIWNNHKKTLEAFDKGFHSVLNFEGSVESLTQACLNSSAPYPFKIAIIQVHPSCGVTSTMNIFVCASPRCRLHVWAEHGVLFSQRFCLRASKDLFERIRGCSCVFLSGPRGRRSISGSLADHTCGIVFLLLALNCQKVVRIAFSTPLTSVAGPWHARLSHWRLKAAGGAGEHLGYL